MKARKTLQRLQHLKGKEEYTFVWRTEWEYFLELISQQQSRKFRSGLSRWLFLIKEKGVFPELENDAMMIWNRLFASEKLPSDFESQILNFGNWFLQISNPPPPLIKLEKDEKVDSIIFISVIQTEPEVVGFSPIHQKRWIIELGKNSHFDFLVYFPLLEIGQKISLFHFREDEQVLKVTEESRLVLDPDLLLSVSDISEVFGPQGAKWKAFFGNKLKIEKFSLPLLTGILANDLLDQMVIHQPFHPDWILQTIRKALLKNKLQAALFSQLELKEVVEKIQRVVAPILLEFVQRIRQESKDIRIEPTFVSVADGITGRLDLLIETDTGAMDIIELKSGKAPEAWIDLKYEVQTILYYRLIRQTYGEDSSVSGAILYASSSDRSLRNLNVDQIYPYLVQIDEARNQIITTSKRLASFQLHEVHAALKSLDSDFEPKFVAFGIKKVQFFLEGYASISNFSEPHFLRTYFLGMFSVQMREWFSLKLGDFQGGVHRKNTGASSIWNESPEEKLDKFSMIHQAELLEIQAEKLIFSHQGWPHPFRLGSPVQLTACDENGNAIPLKEQWMRGVITDLNETQLMIETLAPRYSNQHLQKIPFFNMEEVFLDSNVWATLKSLSNLFPNEKNKKTLEKMLGISPPIFQNKEYSNKFRSELAVEMATAAEDYLLIQGPPGTGKTSRVLTQIVQEFWKRNEKTVVLAFTNRAVDEIAQKLKKREIPYFSLRSEEGESYPTVQSYTEALKNAPIYVSTIASFTARFPDFLVISGEIPNLIVDEASQVTESQLAGIIPLFKRFILIGDHQQLPPVLGQDIELNDLSKLKSFQNSTIRKAMEELEEKGLFSRWTDSLFERLWFLNDRNGWKGRITLDTHFRMHQDIAASIAHHYLPTQLVAGTPEQLGDFALDDSWSRVSENKRLVFWDNRSMDRGKVNRIEAEKIAQIIFELIQRKKEDQPWSDFMGIITPWRAQIEEIRRAIRLERERNNWELELEKFIPIDTVERFQGSESDYIFFSTCINGENYLEALTSTTQNGVDRKLLVAISRARQQFILLGNAHWLNDAPHYQQLLSFVEKNGKKISKD